MKVNVNDEVLFTESQLGIEAFDRFHSDLGLDPEECRSCQRQSDGRLKMPLWQVMQIYGQATTMGSQSPIENNSIEFLSKEPPQKPYYYRDEMFCSHCGKGTQHKVHDTEHERDSSGDWRECLVCHWTKTGHGDYEPPTEIR